MHWWAICTGKARHAQDLAFGDFATAALEKRQKGGQQAAGGGHGARKPALTQATPGQGRAVQAEREEQGQAVKGPQSRGIKC